MTDQQGDGMTEIDRMIDRAIAETAPPLSAAVTDGERDAVARKLRSLPRLCGELEQAGGLDALLLSLEVERIRCALEEISADPYYSVIPALYFQGATLRAAAKLCHCETATARLHRDRLLDRLAVRLGEVSLWDETRNL